MTFAFVFPGQGSQSVGMMSGFAGVAEVEATFAEASDVLGQNFWAMVQDGTGGDLNETIHTQPAMLTAGVAVWRVWQARGGKMPALMAGHSLGEYSALVAAGVLGFADAVRLVRLRAEAMQSAVPAGVGAMAAILGLDDDALLAACAEAAQGEVVAPVNFNSPGQTVIAGNKGAVERAMEAAKARGAKRAMPLPVSVPSHCALMKPAADKLTAALADISLGQPLVPVLHNVDVQSHADAAMLRQALAAQLYSPVRWVDTMRALSAQGVTQVAECGPGKVLAGLTKRSELPLTGVALTDLASLEAALNDLS